MASQIIKLPFATSLGNVSYYSISLPDTNLYNMYHYSNTPSTSPSISQQYYETKEYSYWKTLFTNQVNLTEPFKEKQNIQKPNNIVTTINEKILEKVISEPSYFVDFKPLENKRRVTLLPETNLVVDRSVAAIGKRLTILNETIFGPSLKNRVTDLSIVVNREDIDDIFRLVIGNYYSIDSEGKELIYYNGIDDSILSISNYVVDGIDKPSDVNRGNKKVIGTMQTVLLLADTSANSKFNGELYDPNTKERTLSFDQTLWETFVRGGAYGENNYPALIQQGKYFYDYATTLDLPFSDKELKNLIVLNSPLRYNIEPYYNYFIKRYEQELPNIPDNLLPNMYVMLSEAERDIPSDKDFQKVVTLNGLVNPYDNFVDQKFNVNLDTATQYAITFLNVTNTKQFSQLNKRTNLKTIKDTASKYFEKFANKYKVLNTVTSDEALNRIKEGIRQEQNILNSKLSHIALPIKNINLIKEYSVKKYMFPMFFNLSFSTDKTTQLADMIKESNLFNNLMSEMIDSLTNNVGYSINNVVEVEEVISEYKNANGTVSLDKQYSFTNRQRRVWDISSLLQEIDKVDDRILFDENLVVETNEDVGIFLGGESKRIRTKTPTEDLFRRRLFKLIFVGKLRRLVKGHMRTYREMLAGKKAYSETIMYRVEKSLANRATGRAIPNKVIQNFYFPNSNEIDVLEFVDTQVKYNTAYSYVVYAYHAVIGTQYLYNGLSVRDKYAAFTVEQTPYIVLMEEPYFFVGDVLLDNPPVEPQVDVIPYRGIKNKILFNFNGNVGEYLLKPITILQSDLQQIEFYRQSGRIDEDGKMVYRSDDHSGYFQIFRINEHPKSYKDFDGHLIAAVKTDISELTPQEATSAAYIDDIIPNTKYFYTFRVVDNHGHISNPTGVYRVEMIDNKGSVYPIIEMVDFAEDIKKKPIKEMKRFIQIVPKFSQGLVDEEKSKLTNSNSVQGAKDIFLGLDDEVLFGKRFKIRLTSKNTGKKIDFNVYFDHKHVRVEGFDNK